MSRLTDRMNEIAEMAGITRKKFIDYTFSIKLPGGNAAKVMLKNVDPSIFPKGSTSVEDFATLAKGTGTFRCDNLEGILASGRKFTYSMNDFRFPVNASQQAAKEFAYRVSTSKYVYCDWDKNNKESHSENDIKEFIESFVLHCVEVAESLK